MYTAISKINALIQKEKEKHLYMEPVRNFLTEEIIKFVFDTYQLSSKFIGCRFGTNIGPESKHFIGIKTLDKGDAITSLNQIPNWIYTQVLDDLGFIVMADNYEAVSFDEKPELAEDTLCFKLKYTAKLLNNPRIVTVVSNEILALIRHQIVIHRNYNNWSIHTSDLNSLNTVKYFNDLVAENIIKRLGFKCELDKFEMLTISLPEK